MIEGLLDLPVLKKNRRGGVVLEIIEERGELLEGESFVFFFPSPIVSTATIVAKASLGIWTLFSPVLACFPAIRLTTTPLATRTNIPKINMPASIPTQDRPFACPYCERPPYIRDVDLRIHLRSFHAEYLDHYLSGLEEESRKRTADQTDNPPLEMEAPAARRAREAQDQYFVAQRAVISTRSNAHDQASPERDERTGNVETFLPHHIKTRNKAIELGPPRQTDEVYHRTVKHPHTLEGDQLEDVPIEDRKLDPRNHNMDLFGDFESADDFKAARWFTKYRISETAITDFFNDGIGRAHLSYTSPYTLNKKLDSLEQELGPDSWKHGKARFGADSKNALQSYYFRDLEALIRYLIEQPYLRDHMVYYPVEEYRNDTGQRIYTEPHTAEWWAKEQVRNSPFPSTPVSSFFLLLSFCFVFFSFLFLSVQPTPSLVFTTLIPSPLRIPPPSTPVHLPPPLYDANLPRANSLQGIS